MILISNRRPRFAPTRVDIDEVINELQLLLSMGFSVHVDNVEWHAGLSAPGLTRTHTVTIWRVIMVSTGPLLLNAAIYLFDHNLSLETAEMLSANYLSCLLSFLKLWPPSGLLRNLGSIAELELNTAEP